MSASSGSLPPAPDGSPDEGSAVLLAALEAASDAVFCLAADGSGPLWANARARGMDAARNGLPEIAGRPLADLVDVAVRSGHAETLHGTLGEGGPVATATVRPMTVAGGPGALVVVEAPAGDDVHPAQRSLLPPSLPMLPDVGLSGSYHRATDLSAAGGDWYDAVPLGKGRVALVVGDAVGHGVPAAGAMSRLRGAMRSTVLRDPEPASVLAALDAFAAEMDDVEGTSVFYGVLDAATGRLVYSAAGHPAPLVVHADGRSSFLDVTPRPPLGSLPGAPAPVHEDVLRHGATLVLFSNGAVAGAEQPAEALEHLGQAARGVLAEPGALDVAAVAGLAGAIAEGARRPDGWLDDVAVLVAHRRATTQEALRLDLLAVPSALPGVRRRLNAWLTGLGMGEQDRVGVMVAVGEACANAAEHAYRGTEPGPMSVTAQVDVDGVLTVTVHDEGNWRPPDRDPGDRGRGLLIMRQLVDGVTLEEDHGTTVTLSFRLRRTPDESLDEHRFPDNADVVVDRDGERPVVRARGAVDTAAAEQLRIRMLEASHGGATPMELDLAGVGLFSSAAVRVVLAMARIARDESWRLVVHAPEGGVTRHVLEISGLDGLVELR
ncbi:SpoIIE family protein phosphatase [Blastococcus sp. HT6-30]|uniref:SpoIIE family protein phosphatase n=1 Tax=Blastococcus sp. HT6-30 TaxID=3144843 RepID=UPI003218E959